MTVEYLCQKHDLLLAEVSAGLWQCSACQAEFCREVDLQDARAKGAREQRAADIAAVRREAEKYVGSLFVDFYDTLAGILDAQPLVYR